MATLIHKTGDLFTTEAQAIGHGVNTVGVMGHGIAVHFRNMYPDMYSSYRTLCREGNLRPGETMAWSEGDKVIYNIASQDLPGPNAKLYWLIDGVWAALNHAADHGISTLALPRIGSGIGGLDQNDVESALKLLAESASVDIELWTLG